MALEIHDYGQQVDKDETKAREDLEKRYGKVWNTDEVRKEFDIVGFSAPFVVAICKSDNTKGSLEFTHSPRLYFNFIKD